MVSASERQQERLLALLHSQWVHRYGFSSLPVIEAADLLISQKLGSRNDEALVDQEVKQEVKQEVEQASKQEVEPESLSLEEVSEATTQDVITEKTAPLEVSRMKVQELSLETNTPLDSSSDVDSIHKVSSNAEVAPLEAPGYLRKLEQFTALIGDCLDEVSSTLREDPKPLSQVGTVLRRAREQQGLTIDALAKSLRIGQEQLIALEKGDETQLPEPVFIKAMVRRVAERLHLDETPLIKQLQGANLSGKAVQPQQVQPQPFQSQPVQPQQVQSQPVQTQPVQTQQVEEFIQSNAAQFQVSPDSEDDSAMDLASQSLPSQSQAPLAQEALPKAPIAPPPPPALNKLRRWLPGADD